MDVGRPSLDHLSIFIAVADCGSFTRAARDLGRAVSVVSYAIATLEAQLGVRLFVREGSRRPSLTEAGRAVLDHARTVHNGVDALIGGVRALNQGLESELTLAVDVMVPLTRLAGLLREFQLAFPTVDLRLHVEQLGAVADLVMNGDAVLGIAGPDIAEPPDLLLQTIATIDLIPVAAPHHPLALMAMTPPGIPSGTARHYRQLVLTDRSRLTEGRDFGVIGGRSWRLGDLGAKHALLREGTGWGNMPRHMVERDLAEGRLVRLPVPEMPMIHYPLRAVWRRDCPPGPARDWLVDRFKTIFADPTQTGLARPDPA